MDSKPGWQGKLSRLAEQHNLSDPLTCTARRVPTATMTTKTLNLGFQIPMTRTRKTTLA